MTKNVWTVFDIWADLSYAHYQWLKGTIDNAEFSKTTQDLLRELKSLAEEVKSESSENLRPSR